MNSGIHFIGKDTTIAALGEFDQDYWGLFQGKTPILYGHGISTLGDWLERFATADSSATYTVRLYDHEGQHTYATPYVCSFNFKLTDHYQGMGIMGGGIKLAERLAALEKKEKEENDGDSLGSVIMGWFKDPEQLDIVAGVVQKLLGRGNTNQIQTMGALNPPGAQPDQNEKLLRLTSVLDKLEQKDPKLLQHLEKLASMDDLTLKLILTRLDGL